MVICTGALFRVALFQVLNSSLKFLKSKVVLCIDVTELLQLIKRHQVTCFYELNICGSVHHAQ